MPAFPDVAKIRYEGPDSKNPLAFRHYNADELVEGKTMKGPPPLQRGLLAHLPRHRRRSVRARHHAAPLGGRRRLGRQCRPAGRVAFEFIEKLGAPFYCFHDRDVAPEGAHAGRDQQEPRRRRQGAQGRAAAAPASSCSGARPTCSAIPRYMHGAATSCNADVFAFAAAQVKKALEVTKELGGAGYVFWGGREGYQTPLEHRHEARAGPPGRASCTWPSTTPSRSASSGQFYFEPKPKEPTKHQYDFDAAACINFLRAYGLADHVKLNIETNHATLAGHTFEHELDYAGHAGLLGLDRRQHRRPAARLGHRPVPHRRLSDDEDHAGRS